MRNIVFSRWRTPAVLSAVVLSALLSWAGKNFVMPTPKPAKSYPAHDEHPTEAAAVGLDPYDMADKASIFTIHYNDLGLMPIFVVVSNDGDQPISLSGMQAQLVTVNRTKIPPATEDDIYRRLSHPSASTGPSLPLPFPRKKVRGGVSEQQSDEIHNAQFGAKAVEPHSSQAGFLFFDVGGISTPLAGAQFYVTGVRDSKGNELMYFEIPLEKYLSAPESKPN
jgi:hypothetical protein